MMPAPQSDPQSAIRTIPAGEFKAKCLQLIDEVNEKKLTLIVTKRGRPVSQVVPLATEEKPFVPLWGRSPNIRILGDIMKPMEWADPGEKWRRANKSSKSKKPQ